MSTAVILAGGQSRRMGRDKTQLLYGGKTLLEGAVQRFSACFDRVWVSVADPAKYPQLQAEQVADEFPGCGPLAGLHAALKKTPDEGVFLVAADLPFSDPRAALKLMELCGDCHAAILADEEGRFEPAFAYYRKELLPDAEAALQAGQYKMVALLDNHPVRRVSPAELGELWQPNLLDNINYPEDYRRITGEFTPHANYN